MSEIFNQYSFLWMTLLALLVITGVLRLLRLERRTIVSAVCVTALTFTGAWLVLRQSNTDVSSMGTAETLIGNGKPTLVEFFSQY